MQDAALQDVAGRLGFLSAGQHPNNKPLVLLFAGPSGSGKTETAKQISRIIANQPLDARCFLNMGQYQLEHEVAKLNGAANGYAGSPDGELAFLQKCTRPIVILDEVEKAHSNALMFFLSVFDEGQFKTGDGKLIDCKHAIFVMTSNVGQEVLVEKAADMRQMSSEARQDFVVRVLKPKFLEKGWKDFFWNRIDMCVPFLPLSKEAQLLGAKYFLQVILVLCCTHHLQNVLQFAHPSLDPTSKACEACKLSIVTAASPLDLFSNILTLR